MSAKKPWMSSTDPRKATRTARTTASTFSRTSRFLTQTAHSSISAQLQRLKQGEFRRSPVKQRQQRKAVKMQAHPQEGQKPQAVILPCLPGGRGRRGVVWAQRGILEIRTQVILLLQQLRVHRQQSIRADVMEGNLQRLSDSLTSDTQTLSYVHAYTHQVMRVEAD